MLVSLVISLDEFDRLTVGIASYCSATADTHKGIVLRIEFRLEDLILSNGLITLAINRLISSRGLLQFLI